MLISAPTHRGTGMLLEGDYYDLQALHSALYGLSDPLDHLQTLPQFELVMNLAYDVRHAMQGDRLKRKTLDAGIYYGFRYDWPALLVVTNVLRYSVSLVPPSLAELTQLNLLEASMLLALTFFDEEGAVGIASLVGTGIAPTGPLFGHLAQSLTGYYLNQRATKERFRSLPEMVANYFTAGRPAYQQVTTQVQAAADLHGCSIAEITITNYPKKVIW